MTITLHTNEIKSIEADATNLGKILIHTANNLYQAAKSAVKYSNPESQLDMYVVADAKLLPPKTSVSSARRRTYSFRRSK